MLTTENHHHLLTKCLNIKKRFLNMYAMANAGHIGSSLSCVEMLTFIRFALMAEHDELILSKGHAAAALYSLLVEYGSLNASDVDTFYQDNTYLAAHPPANKIKGVPFATGSLGHGLSLAAGLALAARLKNNHKKIYCVTSDGELNEGSIWEAMLFVVQNKLNNLVWFIDRNYLQGFGKTEDVMHLEPLDEKLKAFGFNVLKVDGHCFKSMREASNHLDTDKPNVLICKTIKGRAWQNMQDKVDCHYLPFKENQLTHILSALDEEYAKQMNEITKNDW